MRAALLFIVVAAACLPPAPTARARGLADSPEADVQSPASSAATNPEDLLAAESLRYSAMSLIHASPQTPGRAGRLVALGKFAQKLQPDHPKTAWLLGSIYEIQGRLAEAAEATRVQLMREPANYALGLKYLRLGAAACSQADERAEFFRSLMDGPWPNPLRAQAAMGLSRLLAGQGRQQEADEAAKQATRLDPDGADVLVWTARARRMDPYAKAAIAVRLLQADPRNAVLAKSLALAVGAGGMHQEALALTKHAWALAGAPDVSLEINHQLVVQYLNTTLDAGRYEEAIASFEPMLVQYPRSSDLRLLLIEAYQALGRQAEAEELIKAMEAEYDSAEADSTGSPLLARESAWFYTLIDPKPERALAIARKVVEGGLDDATSQRILAVAQLRSGREDLLPAAVSKLQALADHDAYAAAVLADHYAGRGALTKAKELVIRGANAGLSGPGWRYLRRIAERHSIDIPPPSIPQALRRPLASLVESYLPIGRQPEAFLKVELRPVRATVTAGQPVEIEASLTNRADVMIQLGEYGLMNATLSPRVAVSGRTERLFEDLPLVVWPAPKYLRPGQTVTTTVRLDVGGLANFLTKHVLEEFTLRVSGLVDPIQKHKGLVSSFSPEAVRPVSIRHADPLGSFDRDDPAKWKTAYQRMLRLTVTEINHGPLQRRLAAVRRLAALLALAGEVRAGRMAPPEPLIGTFSRPVLLSMLRKVLADPSPVIRAEMLAALGQASLDEQIVSLLGVLIEDPSPLVRFRLTELLGASGLPGQDVMIERFAHDDDEMVRAMALAFRGGQP